MSPQENPSSLRLQILARHLAASPQNMASEKEAALAAVPYGSLTMTRLLTKKYQRSSCSRMTRFLHSGTYIAPQAPTHILLIPKVRDGLTGISKAEEKHCEILGRLLYTAKLVAKQEGLEDGFRLVINNGSNGCMIDIHTALHKICSCYLSC